MQPDDARTIVDTAWELGVRTFDTAPIYGFGLGEHRLGAALDGRPATDRVVSTKVGRRLRRISGPPHPTGPWVDAGPFEAFDDYSYDGALRSIEDSMARLMMDQLDVVLIHDVDSANHGPQLPARLAEALDGALPALVRLKEEGVIRAIGFGVNETAVCMQVMNQADVDCFLVAGRYTLLEQGPLDDFLPACLERGIGVILGGIFNSGILAQGPVEGARYNFKAAAPELIERTRRLSELCARYDVPLAAAALQFSAAHPAVSTLCVGVSRPDQLRKDVALLDLPIPVDLWEELKYEGHLRRDAPTP